MSSQDIENVKMLIFIVIVIIAIALIYRWIKHNLKHKDEVIIAYTGMPGSGKSSLSVDDGLRIYAQKKRQYKWRLRWQKFKNLFRGQYALDLDDLDYPQVYSNVPIVIYKPSKFLNWLRRLFHLEEKHEEFCTVLKFEHLLLQERMTKGCIILLDEIGEFASQFDYTEQNVMLCFNEFVRLIRHYYTIEELNIEPTFICNDQCSENINLVVRRRLAVIHNLNNFFHIWRFGFYFERMISISEEIKTIDYKTGQGVGGDTQDNSNFRWKWFRSFGRYDSHCYSERVESIPFGQDYVFTRKKTTNLLVCPKDKKRRYYPKTTIKDDNLMRKEDV